jgi:hypothetical protein
MTEYWNLARERVKKRLQRPLVTKADTALVNKEYARLLKLYQQAVANTIEDWQVHQSIDREFRRLVKELE